MALGGIGTSLRADRLRQTLKKDVLDVYRLCPVKAIGEGRDMGGIMEHKGWPIARTVDDERDGDEVFVVDARHGRRLSPSRNYQDGTGSGEAVSSLRAPVSAVLP
ncbi:hypothetical protein Trco_000921 [Trichoderma cornu-damae]|uniref:Uncharacterized protein n=1 Tax=Trichoderma cornu-damae TaxID=654480 RepID=A0A9P8QR83_9HYPO|nr:hypothetical protein Trco_000921 [Trichoderma cornu-damae]